MKDLVKHEVVFIANGVKFHSIVERTEALHHEVDLPVRIGDVRPGQFWHMCNVTNPVMINCGHGVSSEGLESILIRWLIFVRPEFNGLCVEDVGERNHNKRFGSLVMVRSGHIIEGQPFVRQFCGDTVSEHSVSGSAAA